MTTRSIASEDAAAAAELVRLVIERPGDLVDPWPPASEMEMLVDMGARGKGQPCHPRVAVEAEAVVGYAALDFSPAMRQAQLVGPVVHPANRRKGHGRALLIDLLDRARQARQKFLKIAVGTGNGAGRTLLETFGFREKACHTCLRLGRPAKLVALDLNGIELRRVGPELADAYFEFTRKLVPRQERQMRNLLKADNYVAILAYQNRKPIACVEVDMRFGDTASVENLDGPPSLLHQGLGNALLAEAARAAFSSDRIQALDLLMSGTDRTRVEALTAGGFQLRDELVLLELRL